MRLTRLTVALTAGPLALGLLGACSGGGDEPPEERVSLQERIFAGGQADFAEQQQLVRECMIENGFEYTPVDNRGTGASALPDPSSEDYVKEFGFGVSTAFLSDFSFEPISDPNSEYRESLDENQRAAYDRALYGQEMAGGSFSGGIVAVPIGGGPAGEGAQFSGPGGCIGEAIEATGGATTVDFSLFDDLRDLEERIKADPRMVEAMQDWSACMAEEGYTYRTRDDAIGEIRDEFADLTGIEFSGEGGGGIVVSVAGTGEDGQVVDPFADVDRAKLADLQAREKAIALVSYECSKEHVAGVEQDVRAVLEDEFLAEHPELGAETD